MHTIAQNSCEISAQEHYECASNCPEDTPWTSTEQITVVRASLTAKGGADGKRARQRGVPNASEERSSRAFMRCSSVTISHRELMACGRGAFEGHVGVLMMELGEPTWYGNFSGSSYGRGELTCWFVGGVWQNLASPSRGRSRRRGGGGGGDSPPGDGASAVVSSSHTFHDGVVHDSDSLAAIMSLRPIGIFLRSLARSHGQIVRSVAPMTKLTEDLTRHGKKARAQFTASYGFNHTESNHVPMIRFMPTWPCVGSNAPAATSSSTGRLWSCQR